MVWMSQGLKVWKSEGLMISGTDAVSRSKGYYRSLDLKVWRSQVLMFSWAQGLKVSRSEDIMVSRCLGLKVWRSQWLKSTDEDPHVLIWSKILKVSRSISIFFFTLQIPTKTLQSILFYYRTLSKGVCRPSKTSPNICCPDAIYVQNAGYRINAYWVCKCLYRLHYCTGLQKVSRMLPADTLDSRSFRWVRKIYL